MGKGSWLPMGIALALLTTGCATEREWTTWRAHPTHYANGNHMAFSVTNMVGEVISTFGSPGKFTVKRSCVFL